MGRRRRHTPRATSEQMNRLAAEVAARRFRHATELSVPNESNVEDAGMSKRRTFAYRSGTAARGTGLNNRPDPDDDDDDDEQNRSEDSPPTAGESAWTPTLRKNSLHDRYNQEIGFSRGGAGRQRAGEMDPGVRHMHHTLDNDPAYESVSNHFRVRQCAIFEQFCMVRFPKEPYVKDYLLRLLCARHAAADAAWRLCARRSHSPRVHAAVAVSIPAQQTRGGR